MIWRVRVGWAWWVVPRLLGWSWGEEPTVREKGNIIKVENDGLEDEVLVEVVRTCCVLALLWR